VELNGKLFLIRLPSIPRTMFWCKETAGVERKGGGGGGGGVYGAGPRVGRMCNHGGGRRAVCFADPDGTQPRVVHAAECAASLTVAVPFFLSDRFAPPDHTLHLVSPHSTHATRNQTVRQTHSPHRLPSQKRESVGCCCA
jgi:hypothetical protein